MFKSYSKCIALCLSVLVVGLVIGVLIGAIFRPNHIYMWVDPVNELSLATNPGDVVEWHDLSNPNGHIVINYHSLSSPCVKSASGDYNPCTVRSDVPKNAVYLYTCQEDSSYICDPGHGPQSGPGGGAGSFGFNRLLQILIDVFRSVFAYFFEASTQRQTSRHTEMVSDSTATILAKPGQAPSQATLQEARMNATPPKLPAIRAEVSCYPSDTGVYYDTGAPGQSNPNDTIHASVGQKIIWGSDTSGTFSITPDTKQYPCQEPPQSDGSLPGTFTKVCTVSRTGTYTAYNSACPGNKTSPTEQINVP